MLMVLQEDLINVMFKCEKILEANNIKTKRLKKEVRMLDKVLVNYQLADDNSIVFNEIVTRHDKIIDELLLLKVEEKEIKNIVKKVRTLINKDDIIEESGDIEPDDYEIGQLD